ncbi:MAG: hypothetical protein FWF29_02885 [Treponema sp.]|nr:hypothetical protein [Treponema sp.]
MNKCVYAIVVPMLLLLGCMSCSRNNGKENNPGSALTVPKSALSEKFALAGFAAVQNTPVYDFSSGKCEWIAALDFGEPLELNPSEYNAKDVSGKTVSFKPKRETIGDSYVNLIPILWNGKSGWISTSSYAPDDFRPGAVIESFIPQTMDNITFHIGDMLVLEPAAKGNALFAPFPGVPITQAVNRKQISFDLSDIEAAKLLAKAIAARSGERRLALLSEAAEKFPESALFPLIRNMLIPEKNETESLVALFSTAVDQAEVHAAPDFTSAVVTRLDQYSDVTTSERTIKPESTDTGIARWYRITAPSEGWIFGTSLEGAD